MDYNLGRREGTESKVNRDSFLGGEHTGGMPFFCFSHKFFQLELVHSRSQAETI